MPKEATSPCSTRRLTGPTGHKRVVLSSETRTGQPEPCRWAQKHNVLYHPRNAETPRGETEARHPGEVGGWQFRPPRLSLPHQAQGWALGTMPAESRGELHTHLLASLPGGEGRHHS